MNAFRTVATLVAVVGITACGSDKGTFTVMPDVTGRQLDAALSDIKDAGYDEKVDVDGGGTFGVVNESNWQVCEQSPAPGKTIEASPRLSVDRSCGEAADSATPTTEAENSPSETASEGASGTTLAPPPAAAQEVLTTENNQELAALLVGTDDCADSIGAFAAKYRGRLIEFDASIGALNNHEDYATRFDILVSAGDFSETESLGPAFQFRDVGMLDLGLTGANVPDSIGVGANLRVVARVEEFIERQCLFLLDPIATTVR